MSKSAFRSEQELHARAKMCWARAQEAAVQAMRASRKDHDKRIRKK